MTKSVRVAENTTLTTRRCMLTGFAGLAAALALPAKAGISSRHVRTFARTQAVLDGYVASGQLPGATAAISVRGSSTVFLEAGTIAFDSPTAMDRHSLFRIYSMTKLITGVAAALLIEDGRLKLDLPVVEIVPEFNRLRVALNPGTSLEATPVDRPMTIRHLLTHTSGMTYHFSGNGPVHLAYRRNGIFPLTGAVIDPRPAIDGVKPRNLDELVDRLADIPLLFQPGTAYEYGASLDVLGLVIERVGGMGFERFVQSRLLDPLGMTDTVWQLSVEKLTRFTSLYALGKSQPFRIDGPPTTPYAEPVTLIAGGAGLISSTSDYMAFLTMLLRGGKAGGTRIAKPETVRLALSNILPAAVRFEQGGHGFGGYVLTRDDPAPGGLNAGAYGHYGAAGTTAWIDPVANVAGSVMVQQFPAHATPIVREIQASVAEDMHAPQRD